MPSRSTHAPPQTLIEFQCSLCSDTAVGDERLIHAFATYHDLLHSQRRGEEE